MRARTVKLHPLILRLCHWSFALAVVILIGSGWRMHYLSGFWSFVQIPVWATLGGEITAAQRTHNEVGQDGALLWHLTAMWLLLASIAVYVVWGTATGHFRRRFLPITLGGTLHDVGAFVRGDLGHSVGVRNTVQKLLYTLAVLGMILMLLTGLSIWKPTQFSGLAALFGGYTKARYIHILGMAGLCGFIFVHVSLVALVPKTLPPMITGRAPVEDDAPHGTPAE